VYGYDPKTKQWSSQWKLLSLPVPKKVCQVNCKARMMLIAFLNQEGVVHREYTEGQTVNLQFI
jgi:hypothetical protein